MAFWKTPKSKKPVPPVADTGQAQPARKNTRGHGPPVAFEAKLLALEAVAGGADKKDLAALLNINPTTITKWEKLYREGGVLGLCRSPSGPKLRKQCGELEKRIIAQRQENPNHGVRRIRDDLRLQEGLAVSAEKVRQTVNEAGLGNPPVTPGPRPPQVRRFERSVPNALWQIDIFTFALKRMYNVYLIGIIDDHSRYLVGWGLFRQQTADAVMEVVKGAIGQWGAPREILSDNGRQFVAWRGKTRFQKNLKQQGIGHVRSAPHHPMTLGKIERFWQSIWREFLEEAVFASFADACQRLDHWVGYYNHQRPHQGISGACPADRFYGVQDDKDTALAHGCQENSLRLALGQEPQRPLYLLGQLGETDVRVVRKGDDIEVKVGDAVHELIRVAAPYRIGEDGHAYRESGSTAAEPFEVEGSGRSAEVRSGGTCPAAEVSVAGPVPDVRSDAADAVPGHGSCGPGLGSGPGAEAERAAGSGWTDEGVGGVAPPQPSAGVGSETAAKEGGGGQGASGSAPEAGPGAVAAWGKKIPEEAEPTGSVRDWWYWLGGGDGQEE
jgi:transposase InsO family protein